MNFLVVTLDGQRCLRPSSYESINSISCLSGVRVAIGLRALSTLMSFKRQRQPAKEFFLTDLESKTTFRILYFKDERHIGIENPMIDS